MFVLPTDIATLGQYAAPPVVGAFIGYITNKIAIKMLFRPLRPWHICGIRVPMTPGVIPAKRHLLAENMGKMVAEHLLTDSEIKKAIEQSTVQDQIFATINKNGEKLFQHELGSLGSLIPTQFQGHYQMGCELLSYKIKVAIKEFLRSEQCQDSFAEALEQFFNSLLATNITSLLPADEQEKLLGSLADKLELQLQRLLSQESSKAWLNALIQQQFSNFLVQGSTISELLPQSLQELLQKTVCNQIGPLLEGAADLVAEDKVQEKIVDGACAAVENFINSMGPMSAMVSNFVSMESVREKIGEYLESRNDEIRVWITGEAATARVNELICQQLQTFLQTPLAELAAELSLQQLSNLSQEISTLLFAQLQKPALHTAISDSITGNIKNYLAHGSTVGEAAQSLLGERSLHSLQKKMQDMAVMALQSPQVEQMIDSGVDNLLKRGKNIKIGRLSRYITEGMRQSFYGYLQKRLSSAMVAELPVIVEKLQLQKIVSDKIDSLDLLKLEKLLLSIMEEQFKYINLFGAGLGFLLGCLNLLFFTMS